MHRVRLAILFTAASAALAGASAAAADSLCIDPRKSYEAHVLSDSDIVVKNTLGKDRRSARVKTSCISLNDEDRITFSSSYSCLGKGDPVGAVTIDGKNQSCTVTGLSAYEPEEEPDAK